MLIRYGFHGYGNPEDDNGIVVFAEDRLVLKELVAEISSPDYGAFYAADFQQLRSIEEAKKLFRRHGSHHAKELAERVATVEADKSPR